MTATQLNLPTPDQLDAEARAYRIASAIDASGTTSVRTSVHYDSEAGTHAVRVRLGNSLRTSQTFDLCMGAPGAIPALFHGIRFVGGMAQVTDRTEPAAVAIALLARIAFVINTGY